jgi:hypothetical protein
VQNYIKELKAKGKAFCGFTEYGRGVVPVGGSISQATIDARIKVFSVDAVYLKSIPTVEVWSYWYTTDGANPNVQGDQWRLLDPASQAAWRAATAQ